MRARNGPSAPVTVRSSSTSASWAAVGRRGRVRATTARSASCRRASSGGRATIRARRRAATDDRRTDRAARFRIGPEICHAGGARARGRDKKTRSLTIGDSRAARGSGLTREIAGCAADRPVLRANARQGPQSLRRGDSRVDMRPPHARSRSCNPRTDVRPTSATSPSSPTSTTARRRWSTASCARRGSSARARWSPTARWTRTTSSASAASPSSPSSPPSPGRGRASTSSTRPATPTSAARSSAC